MHISVRGSGRPIHCLHRHVPISASWKIPQRNFYRNSLHNPVPCGNPDGHSSKYNHVHVQQLPRNMRSDFKKWLVLQGGMYVFQLFDYYSGSRILLLVAFFMCVAVGWIYGTIQHFDTSVEFSGIFCVFLQALIGFTTTSR